MDSGLATQYFLITPSTCGTAQDPRARVACETLAKTGIVIVAGEITTTATVDMPVVIRQTVKDIGYTGSEMGFGQTAQELRTQRSAVGFSKDDGFALPPLCSRSARRHCQREGGPLQFHVRALRRNQSSNHRRRRPHHHAKAVREAWRLRRCALNES